MDEWLTQAARARPDHPAVVAEGRTLTYSELDRAASACARKLAAFGVKDGDLVVSTLPPGIAFCELLHALPRLGAVLAPLDARAAPVLAGRRARIVVSAPLDGAELDTPLRDVVDPGATHTAIRSSGTTGTPKLVGLTYSNHEASARASADALGVEEADRWLCPLPLHHVAGLGVLLRCVINQTTAVIHERFEPTRVRTTLERGEATLVSLVPTMLQRLRAAGLRSAPGLRAVALGGGPIAPELLDWAARVGIPVVPVYGLTETASQVVAGSPGRPLKGVELRLGGEGEILVRGPMVARSELSADGWLHTGDCGSLDRNGRLRVEGRLKDLIVSGGENVSPIVVEGVLLAHPRVVDAGVAGAPDADWGEAVIAFVALAEPVPGDELRAWCRARLLPHEVPKRFVEVAELPRNQAGKLLRDRLANLPAR